MSRGAGHALPLSAEAEPTWEIARLFPAQGTWCEFEYLALQTNRYVELSNSYLEVPSPPTMTHQLTVGHLSVLLSQHVRNAELGVALFGPLPVRLGVNTFREPDILFMLNRHARRLGNEFWKGADLVMEVVSEGKEDRRRDLRVKRQEYAKARIPEYWIVDPQEEMITVLRLAAKRYVVHGTFAKGAVATSHLLPGFAVNVTEALAQKLPGRSATKGRTRTKRRS